MFYTVPSVMTQHNFNLGYGLIRELAYHFTFTLTRTLRLVMGHLARGWFSCSARSIQDAYACVPNGLFPQSLVRLQVYGFGRVNMTQTEVTIQRPPRGEFPFVDNNHGYHLVPYDLLETFGYEVPGWVDVRVIL